MSRFKVSVIIPTRNRPEMLKRLLDSINRAGDPYYELIVVDGSVGVDRQRTENFVRDFGGEYIHEGRRGLSLARNIGIKNSRGEVLVFADDDFIVGKGWIRNLLIHFEDELVACCTGRMLPFRFDELSMLYERSLGFDRGVERRIFGHEDLRVAGLIDVLPRIGCKRLLERTPVPWAVGFGFCSFRRSIFDEVGYFDETLGRGTDNLGGEDVDIFYRILKKGYRIVYEPKAIIYHDHRHTYEGILKDAYASGVSVRALVRKYYKRDLYMFFCMIGAFGLYVTSLIKASIAGNSGLKKMILEEFRGFLGFKDYLS